MLTDIPKNLTGEPFEHSGSIGHKYFSRNSKFDFANHKDIS